MAIVKERVPIFLFGLALGTVLVIFMFSARQSMLQDWRNLSPTDTQKIIALEGKWLFTPRPITAADLKGRMIALAFTQTDCKSCGQTRERLQAIETEFGSLVLTVLVVTSGEAAMSNSSKETSGFDYFIVDTAQNIFEKLRVRQMGGLVLVSPDGQVAGIYKEPAELGTLAPNIRLYLNRFGKNMNLAPIQ